MQKSIKNKLIRVSSKLGNSISLGMGFIFKRQSVVAMACCLVVCEVKAADQFFAGDGSLFTASKWGTVAAGPFTGAFTSGNVANFGVVNGTGTGGSITVGGFTATENFTLTAVTGTLANQANGVVSINVATGKLLDFNSQSFTSSGTAGYTKDGAGAVALAGNTYGGGFTLNSGAVIVRGVNAMGTGGALTINGGAIGANGNRDLSSKYSSIIIGGNIQLGVLASAVSLASDTATLTFSNSVSLGATTRAITIGANGTYTLAGAISGTGSAGLTISNLPGTTGVLNLTNNTFTGNLTLSGGILQGQDSRAVFGGGTFILNGGTFQRAGQNFTPARANAYTNPVSVTANSTIQTTTTTTRTMHFDAPFLGAAGTTLFVTNAAASGTNHFRLYAGGIIYTGNVVIAAAGANNRTFLELYNTNNPLGGSDQTFLGVISGGGVVYKNLEGSNPGGSVIFSNANTYTGGTEIRGGFFGLGADNALGFGNVVWGWDPNPLGLYAVGAPRTLTNDLYADWFSGLASTASGSTNLQINGSQNLTLSGRILIHTNVQQFTISNTATTIFSGIVTNGGATSFGISKQGPGTLLMSGVAAYTGSTRVAGGTLALSGTAVPGSTTNLTIFGGATLDVSALSSTLTLASSQSFQIASPTTNAVLVASGVAGLTLGNASPLLLAYSNGIPSLTVTGGVLTLAVGNPATITVTNAGVGLPLADYKLISTNTGGFVAGIAPASLTVNGDGISGGNIGSLVISNAELYLRVSSGSAPPLTPVAKPASSTNATSFTAAWYAAGGAAGYRLDVSTASDFSSFVSGYADRDIGNVTAFAVTNLSASTTYYYQVRATNSFGISLSSSTVSVTTLDQPYIWNAGGGNWSDTASWQFANPPVNGVLVSFTGAGGTAVNDLTSLGITSLVFSNSAGAYTISGNPLALTNGILNSSASIETISTPLTLGAAQTFNASVGPLNISGPVTNAGFTLTVNAVAASTNSGSISGAGALIKTGASSLLLSGGNTYTNVTTVTGGNLKVSGGSALSDLATLTLANTAGVALTVDTSETVGSISGGDSSTVALGANNLIVGGDGTTNTLTSSITGTGKLIKTGTGTLTLNKATPYGSDFVLRVEGGTVDLNRGGNSLGGILGGTNRVELAGGTLQVSGGLQATLAFTNGGFDVYSNSTIFFTRLASSATSHANSSPLNFKNNATLTFGYGPNITSGTTTFDAATNTLQGNAILALGAFDIAIANPIVESGGSYGVTKTGAGQLNLSGINTYSGPTTNLQGTIQVNATSTFGNGSGTLVLAGGNILDANTRAGAPIANPILMTANTTIYGNGTLTDGSSRYFPLSNNSITTVGGTLTVRNAGASGINEFRLRFTGGGFNFTQPIIVGSPSDVSTLTTALHIYNDTNVPAQTFSGNISGTGSIVKSAPIAGSGGVTILSGSNSYAGGTVVSEGTLLVNNTTGSGTGTNLVAVTSGGTLGGTGIILGTVTNSFGSTLAPGLGGLDTSTLTISNNLGLAGNALFVLNRTNAQKAAKVSGLASVRYGGTLTLTNVGDALQAGDTFTLFSAAAYTGGFTNYVLPAIDPSLVWVTNNLPVNGTVSVALGIAPTALSLSSSSNPSGYLDALTFTATVTPSAATGSVVFYAGATPFSTNSLTLGSATSGSISSLARGTTSITAIYGGSMSYFPSTNSLAQVVTNHPPVAGNVSFTRYAGMSTLHIAVSNLLSTVTDADMDSPVFETTSVSTNGVTLSPSPGYLHYYNVNNVDDQFTYTVSDGFGGTNSATVSILISTNSVFGQSSPSINTTGGSATLSFAGIPGFSYSVVRSTNVTFVPLDIIWTTNAPAGGLFDYTDSAPPQPSAFYRLQWNP